MKIKKSIIESGDYTIDELVDLDGSSISGDFKSNGIEIETGPINKTYDDSTYKKGISTTTDKWSQYAQPRSWWALYYGYGGTPYSHGKRPISENDETVLEKFLKKRTENEISKARDKSVLDKLNKIKNILNKKDLSDKDKNNEINNILKDSE